jgi:hypothetical protein
LLIGHVHLGLRLGIEPRMTNVGDNADNLGRLPEDGKLSPDELLAWEVRAREAFIDEHDRSTAGSIGVGQRASLDESNAHRAYVA